MPDFFVVNAYYLPCLVNWIDPMYKRKAVLIAVRYSRNQRAINNGCSCTYPLTCLFKMSLFEEAQDREAPLHDHHYFRVFIVSTSVASIFPFADPNPSTCII